MSTPTASSASFKKSSSKDKSLKRSRSDAVDSSHKKAKAAVPMALFVVIGCGGNSTGYFVPLSLLPPIEQVLEDIEERGSEEIRVYYKGKEISRTDEDRIDELHDVEDFGDILSGCIVPLAVKSLSFSESKSLKASVQCEVFAFVEEDF